MSTNMIIVDGVSIPDPSALTYGLQDVSASDAGRDEATTMHKMRVGQKRTYNLEWKMINPAETSQILTAFNPEYFYVTVWDSLDGEMQTRQYYCGDRQAVVQQWMPSRQDGKLYQRVAFTIIEV